MDDRIIWMYVAILKEKKKIQTYPYQLDKENTMCKIYYAADADYYGHCFRIELFDLVDSEHCWVRDYWNMNHWRRNLVYYRPQFLRSKYG